MSNIGNFKRIPNYSWTHDPLISCPICWTQETCTCLVRNWGCSTYEWEHVLSAWRSCRWGNSSADRSRRVFQKQMWWKGCKEIFPCHTCRPGEKPVTSGWKLWKRWFTFFGWVGHHWRSAEACQNYRETFTKEMSRRKKMWDASMIS